MKTYLVTGAAGFIGHFVCERLLERGDFVVGLDNLNNYYSPSLKEARLRRITKGKGAERFFFKKASIDSRSDLEQVFDQFIFNGVVHLAAQAGVRYSLDNPHTYINSNVTGFLNIIEGVRSQLAESRSLKGGTHIVYASSSSVYGGNRTLPFSENHSVDTPISLYAATKKSNELMGHTYSHLFGIPMTALRFFTVYGPWGRPDMAAFKFTKSIINGEEINVYNYGNMRRDFTFIDDIVEGVLRVLDIPPTSVDTADGNFSFSKLAPHRVLNIGNNQPQSLLDFISILEEEIGVSAIKKMSPLQPGDVPETYADTSRLFELTGFVPATSLKDGLKKFVSWYRSHSDFDI